MAGKSWEGRPWGLSIREERLRIALEREAWPAASGRWCRGPRAVGAVGAVGALHQQVNSIHYAAITLLPCKKRCQRGSHHCPSCGSHSHDTRVHPSAGWAAAAAGGGAAAHSRATVASTCCCSFAALAAAADPARHAQLLLSHLRHLLHAGVGLDGTPLDVAAAGGVALLPQRIQQRVSAAREGRGAGARPERAAPAAGPQSTAPAACAHACSPACPPWPAPSPLGRDRRGPRLARARPRAGLARQGGRTWAARWR
jgi:hypothetical protein